MADTTSPGLGNLDPDQAGSNQTTQNQPGLLKSERNGLGTQPTRHRNPGGGFWPLIPARMSLTRIVAPMFVYTTLAYALRVLTAASYFTTLMIGEGACCRRPVWRSRSLIIDRIPSSSNLTPCLPSTYTAERTWTITPLSGASRNGPPRRPSLQNTAS